MEARAASVLTLALSSTQLVVVKVAIADVIAVLIAGQYCFTNEVAGCVPPRERLVTQPAKVFTELVTLHVVQSAIQFSITAF
jgi:hypothetical protein